MDDSGDRIDDVLRSAAGPLTGYRRRRFRAEVTRVPCAGHARRAGRRFGRGRADVEAGVHERASGIRCVEHFGTRGQRRTGDANPQLAADIRDPAGPHTPADPELKSDRRYTDLSARDACERLRTEKGYAAADLPGERTMRDILNRMGYRLGRIQKGKPPKKTPETDAPFASVTATRAEAAVEAGTPEIAADTRAKVGEGEYARGGKTRTRSDGTVAKGWDHDPPATRAWTPLGIRMVVRGTWTLLFGSKEASDFWVGGLKAWWGRASAGYRSVRRLVIYSDNGRSSSRGRWSLPIGPG